MNTITTDGEVIKSEILENKEEGSLMCNFAGLFRSYALEIIMFNGVKVFVTNNNQTQEVLHMYKKENGGNWNIYGVRPSKNAISESIKNINKLITDQAL